ncbi:PIN domain-containing protein [Okeania sp. SIO1I7]|uniref:PIN domain-containing protein n=1 Tax=Okeania sp. SIO1I7 TaxID=2607772 RepID=UPI0013F8C97A|nr:type II toxin-antitoxin system VapC family toxin [Okeania sp. SIO1I7]NET26103.1 type II toxin-antitoxin system VapC family toxin [Okeania sp. SIO1I7]
MIGVDTNILVRYLTRDDELQWQKALEIIRENQPCFVSNIVLCELVWVLKSQKYRFTKDRIINILEMMLQSTVFELENPSVIYQAIERTKQGSADFSDYLIGVIARRAGCAETVTFDRKLRGEIGFNCLE